MTIEAPAKRARGRPRILDFSRKSTESREKASKDFEAIKEEYDKVSSQEIDLSLAEAKKDEAAAAAGEEEPADGGTSKKRQYDQIEGVAKSCEKLAKRARLCKQKTGQFQDDEAMVEISRKLDKYDSVMSAVCRITRNSIAPKVDLIAIMADLKVTEASGIQFARVFEHKIMGWRCDSRLRLAQYDELGDCFSARSVPASRQAYAVILLESTMCRLVRGVTPESVTQRSGPFVALGEAMAAMPCEEDLLGGESMRRMVKVLTVFADPQECSVADLKVSIEQFCTVPDATEASVPAPTPASSPSVCEDDPEAAEIDLDAAQATSEESTAVVKAITGTKGGLALLRNARGWLARREQEIGVDELVASFSAKLDKIKADGSVVKSSQDLRDELKVLLAKEKFMNAKAKRTFEQLRQPLSM